MYPAAAPGRPLGRPGAFVRSLLLGGAVALAGCDALGGRSSIVLDSAEVRIDGSVHEIRVAGAGATDSLAPSALDAEPGDAVRFIIDDRRAHALAFVEHTLDPAVRDYLERTGQLRGPPLVNEGSSWVVVLEDAPPGRYPFLCRSHDVHGELTVTGER